jgi:hypothetical protein
MKQDVPRRDTIEFEQHEISWTTGVGRPAGIYWLAGRPLIAAHDSPGEARLLAAGAVLVATLRFDPDPLDSVQHGRTVERVSARSAARDFLLAGAN